MYIHPSGEKRIEEKHPKKQRKTEGKEEAQPALMNW